jgi:hypothetical protein
MPVLARMHVDHPLVATFLAVIPASRGTKSAGTQCGGVLLVKKIENILLTVTCNRISIVTVTKLQICSLNLKKGNFIIGQNEREETKFITGQNEREETTQDAIVTKSAAFAS